MKLPIRGGDEGEGEERQHLGQHQAGAAQHQGAAAAVGAVCGKPVQIAVASQVSVVESARWASTTLVA